MFLEFVGLVTGSVLVAAAPNPPTTTPQMVGGAVLGGGAAVSAGITLVAAVRAAVREELRAPALEEAGERPRATPGRFQRHFRTVFALLLVVVVLLVAGPPVVGLLRGLSYRVYGCPPATQLRMVAEPETIATARELAVAYERGAAEDGYGCPAARIYVFAASAPTLTTVLESADGWTGTQQALSRVGPTPDMWLASTSHEVAAVRSPAGSGVHPIASASRWRAHRSSWPFPRRRHNPRPAGPRSSARSPTAGRASYGPNRPPVRSGCWPRRCCTTPSGRRPPRA